MEAVRAAAYVYPGHPLVIGLLIMRKYPDLADARARDRGQHPAALRDAEIPGAGGNVYSALTCLEVGLLHGAERAEEFAGAAWARCDNQRTRNPKRWADGIAGARMIRDEFREALAGWSSVKEDA